MRKSLRAPSAFPILLAAFVAAFGIQVHAATDPTGNGPSAPSAALSDPGAPASSAKPSRSQTPPLDIKEIRLDNGLRIFVLERTASPTFAAAYAFRVGGAMDPKGRSGIAHLLEHMMFKGTRTIGTLDSEKEESIIRRISELWHDLVLELDRQDDPFARSDPQKIEKLRKEIEDLSAEEKKLIVKNEFDEVMSRAGAVGENASTSNDWTNYYMALPSNRLELWFRMESDRLMNPVFREFYSERDVVHEERRLSTENSPSGLASEALDSLMFPAHPYGTPVLGWPRDVERLSMEDALAYFRTYYSPSNCVMAIAGDVSAKEVESLARKYLSGWKRQDLPTLQVTSELEQKGERRRVVEFDAEPRILIGWPVVPEGHADQPALDVLGALLGGLESSRMDKTIVQEERIATSVFSYNAPLRWAGQFFAGGTVREGRTAAELESAVDREVARIQKDGVSAVELERAKILTEVQRVRRLKSNFGLAFEIMDAVMTSGSTDYVRESEERLNAVTSEQVRDAARKYLTPSRKNVVELRKTEGAGTETGEEVVHQRGGEPGTRGEKHSTGFAEAMSLIASGKPIQLKVPEIGKDVQRVKLPSGIVVFIKEDHSAPSIAMSFRWTGGSNSAPVTGLAPFQLASQLLNEGGTESLDPMAFSERREDLGMDFNYYIGGSEGGGTFWSLKRNFGESFDLALDLLMRPRLDPERLKTIKGQYIDRMRRRGEVPARGADIMQTRVLYGDHPRFGYVAPRKEIEAITPEQIRQIWRRYVGRDNMYVTAVGDFQTKEMLDLIQAKLGSWRKAEDKERRFLTMEPVVRAGATIVERDLPQPAVVISHLIPVDRSAPETDHAALEILNDILGGSGFRSRLMERLRSDEGLTYGISSYIAHDGRPGMAGSISIDYQTKKISVARSIDSVLEELRRIIGEDVSAPEVAEQIESWRNRFVFRYTSDFFSVTRLMDNELDERPYDFDRRRLEAVQKVTVADVRRAAEKYLKPGNVTICIYGTPTSEDRAKLEKEVGVKVLRKEDVFKGGYDEESVKPAR